MVKYQEQRIFVRILWYSSFFLQTPRIDPKRETNYTKNLHENKTNGFDRTNGTTADVFEKLEKLNYVKINLLK